MGVRELLSITAVLAALTGCAEPMAPPPAVPVQREAEPSWEAVAAEATAALVELIRIPTVNPPGQEAAAATALAERIRREGIEAIVDEGAPGRGNVMARLRGDGSKRPIVLLCHLDVVPVERAGWKVDPFAGKVDQGVVWGRGAIDDKGMCVVNLLAFLELHRRAVPLARDVVFLATAGEEVDGGGVKYMLGKNPQELAAEYVLNEGGIGLTGAVVKGQVLFAVSAAEKGTADIHLIARGKPGHGSTPRADQAPDRLRDALAHLATMESPLVFHAYAWELFRRIGATQGGLTGWMMRHPSVSSGILLGELRKAPSSRASVSNTINLTMIRAGDKVNVVPGVAEAWLDCRLLPGTTPEAMRDRIARELAAYQVEVRLDAGEPATASPWTTDLFRALEHNLVDGAPGAVVAPILSPAFSDSKYFRDRGAVAYGIVPFVVSDGEFEGMHGHDERVEVSELGLGVRRTYRTLVEVARK